MALLFPSRVIASGRVSADALSNNERGALTDNEGLGNEYHIVLERPVAVGWATIQVTPIGAPPIVSPVLLACEQPVPGTFNVLWGASQGGVDSLQAFFYTIFATDDTQ